MKSKTCTHTCPEWGLLILRLGLGFILAYHGYVKVFSTQIAGFGDLATMDMFTNMLTGLGVPSPVFFAWLVGLLECVGGLAIIAGVWTRLAASLIALEFLYILFFVKKFGFPQSDVDLMILVGALALIMLGAGKYSLDFKYSLDSKFCPMCKEK